MAAAIWPRSIAWCSFGGIDIVRKRLTLIVFAAHWAGTLPCLAEEVARLPTIALLSAPPVVVAPSGLPMVPDFVPHVPGRRTEGSLTADPPAIRTRAQAVKAADGVKGKQDEDDDEDEDDPTPPAKPGSLSTSFVKVPTALPIVKNRSLGPHLKPDVTFDLNDRTTVGVISQLDGLRPSTVMSALGRTQLLPPSMRPSSAAPHSMRSRDLGLGATFEFKFGK